MIVEGPYLASHLGVMGKGMYSAQDKTAAC